MRKPLRGPAFRPRPTFANVVSVIALVFALAGTGVASVATISALSKKEKKQTKNIADNEVNRLAPTLAVKSANTANSASTADDAATVGGVSPADLQFGNGYDGALAGVIDSGEHGFLTLAEAAIRVDCGASPTLSYQVGTVAGAFPVELWIDGTHHQIDGTPTELDNVPLTADDTVQIQAWDNNGVVSDVVLSVSWDGGNTQCAFVFSVTENLEGGCLDQALPPPNPCSDIRGARGGPLTRLSPPRFVTPNGGP